MVGSLHPSESWTRGWWCRAMEGQHSELRSRELWGEATFRRLSEITTYSPLLLHCFLHFLSTSLGSTSLVNYLHVNCHFSISLKRTWPKTPAQIKTGWSGLGNTARGDHRHTQHSLVLGTGAQEHLGTRASLCNCSSMVAIVCLSVCVFLLESFPVPSSQTAFSNFRQPCPRTRVRSIRLATWVYIFIRGARVHTHTHTHVCKTCLSSKVHKWIKLKGSRR